MRDFQGVVGPAGMPPALLARIHADLSQVLEMAEVRARIAQLGGETTGGTPATFAGQIRSEAAKWKRVVREAKLSAE